MIEKIKKTIDNNKRNTSSINKYIDSFCSSDKAKELFNDNKEFQSLKKKEEKKEDNYF